MVSNTDQTKKKWWKGEYLSKKPHAGSLDNLQILVFEAALLHCNKISRPGDTKNLVNNMQARIVYFRKFQLYYL